MKKALCILAVSLCFFQLWGGPAYAGSLNENESELVEIITGTYEYEGVTYKVKDLYIDMAIDYLMQDSIDLTNEQKQAAIEKMYSSVGQGISEGYLEVVDAGNDGEKFGAAGGQQGIPGVTEAAGHSAESGEGSAGLETPDGAAQGGNDANTGIGTSGAGEADTEKAKAESEKAQIKEEVIPPVILALESITQEEMQDKLQQENENDELQVQTSFGMLYPVYPWKLAWGVCLGVFMGTIGCIGAVLKVKVFVNRNEKKRRGS